MALAAALVAVAVLASAFSVQRGSAQTQQVTTTPTAPRTATATPAASVTPLAPAAGDDRPRTVTVVGNGSVSAAPDEAFVSLGVQTDADTAADALSQNTQQMDALLEALADAGIPSADIQTQFISLYPRYEEPQPGQTGTAEISGYTAVNNVEVRVADLDNLGDILDAAVAAGSNNISGIRFSVSDTDDLLNEARESAMNDARRKAQQLAALAGGQLGPVMSISEGAPAAVPIIQDGLGGANVQPGTNTLTAQVTVTWALQ
jgi:uncharacterized protein YggE